MTSSGSARTVILTWDEPTTHETRAWRGALPASIGRAPENDITLNSQAISRFHARLEFLEDELAIFDENSTNGVFVNGRQVKRARLQDGGNFQIGPFFITCIIFEPPKRSAPPTPTEVIVSWRDAPEGTPLRKTFLLPITIGRTKDNSLALFGDKVSRNHAEVVWEEGRLILRDLKSTNGTYLGKERVTEAPITGNSTVFIGNFTVTFSPIFDDVPKGDTITKVSPFSAVDSDVTHAFRGDTIDPESTQIFDEPPNDEFPDPTRTPPSAPFPPPVIEEPEVVPIAVLNKLPLTLEETTYLTVGGGLGSFAWVDHLVIYGADPKDIVAIGVEKLPYGRFKRLANNSQIPDTERLRSNSDATPDNIWGWPGYAVREIGNDLRRGKLGHALKLSWQIFSEPTFQETYTPLSGEMYRSVHREARRIGWPKIWRYGRVRAVRKTDDGRYLVAYSQSTSEGGRLHKLMLCKYLHIAVGYPALRYLPDLQTYREETRDFFNVVNAYEDHQHVYDHLQEHGGTVLVRGRGIVASRIIQSLHEARQKNKNIRVLHLMRTPKFHGQKYKYATRVTKNHWEIQPFNWPKAVWGGDLRFLLEKVDDQTRDQLLNDWGGTTTSDRRDWIDIIKTGIEEGWYSIQFGHVERVERTEGGKLVTIIRGKTALQGSMEILADFVIDATGLIARVDNHPLLKDLLVHYNLPRNVKGRLKVTPSFELAEFRNGRARAFATGAITLGNGFAAVDSFLGLQYSARQAVDSLTKARAPGLRKLSSIRSMIQWWKWARGTRP